MAGWDARFAGLFAAAALLLTPLCEGADKAASSQQALVTVEGHRAKLERRVRQFVAKITVGAPETSLQLWRQPICPQVAGLPAGQGEVVLARLSQIALKAGAPLAPKSCHPNFIVVVTPDPPAFIEAWRLHSDGEIFEHATSPMAIRKFIDTPLPVRAWYNTQLDDQHGEVLGKLPADGETNGVGSGFDPVRINSHADDTRIELNALKDLTSVMLFVDAHSIEHLEVGQVADYVGMVGLARLDTKATVPDDPTILNLFSSDDSQKRPARLTEWDEAFLYALYHTGQSSRMQRAAITRSVVKDVARPGE